MDAQEYLRQAEVAGHVKWLAKYNGTECVGQAGALILDEVAGMAVLLENGTLPSSPTLGAGHIVQFVSSPEHGGAIIVGSANLHGDRAEAPAQAVEPAPRPAPATPSTPPAAELESTAKKRRRSKKAPPAG